MPWTYSQSTGVMMNPGGTIIATGYSGHAPHVNDGSAQADPDVGPIPLGQWSIGAAFQDPEKGPCVMRLTPAVLTDTFGRSGFMIHGDEVEHPGAELASHGCIILGPAARLLISQSLDKQLQVTA
jgi:hypothetical protein